MISFSCTKVSIYLLRGMAGNKHDVCLTEGMQKSHNPISQKKSRNLNQIAALWASSYLMQTNTVIGKAHRT